MSGSSTATSGPHPRLGLRAWPTAARLVVLRLVLPILCRRLPVRRLVRVLAAPRRRDRDSGREALVVAIAGRLWRRSSGTCLERSLAIYSELARAGASPALVLAMGRSEGELVGHAWVEVDGRPMLEASDPRDTYATVLIFDANGRLLPTQP